MFTKLFINARLEKPLATTNETAFLKRVLKTKREKKTSLLLAGLFFLFGFSANAQISESPVFFYKLEENDSNYTVSDETINNINAIASDITSTFSVTGYIDNSFYFDNSNYLTVSSSSIEGFLTDQMTLTGWLNINSFLANDAYGMAIFNNGSGSFSAPYIWTFIWNYAESAGAGHYPQLEMYLDDGIGGYAELIPDDQVESLILGEWLHFAVVVDSTGNHKIYINGVNVLRADYSTLETVDLSKFVNTSYIGIWEDLTHGIDGKIDELRLYNIALSESQVNYLYNYTGTEPEPESIATSTINIYEPVYIGDDIDISIEYKKRYIMDGTSTSTAIQTIYEYTYKPFNQYLFIYSIIILILFMLLFMKKLLNDTQVIEKIKIKKVKKDDSL